MKTKTLSDWKVMGSLPYQADFSKFIQEGVEFPVLTDWIDAKVPGSIYTDLLNANKIADPYFGMNSLNCEWVANRWWTYKTTFSLEKIDLETTLKLNFSGIDYSAQIYLNGEKIGNHEGMYLPFNAIINKFCVVGENTLVCILEHAPFADAQPGYTSKTKYMKARFNYKWDFCTRLVNLGLYDNVTISSYETASFDYHFVRPIKTSDGYKIDIETEFTGYENCQANLDFSYSYDYIENGIRLTESSISRGKVDIKKGHNFYKNTILVEHEPLLWYPNGYGMQNLNAYSFSISTNGTISDEIVGKFGFRTIEYGYAENREDALPYKIIINGKSIYLKGTNIVPLCHMQGNVSKEMLNQRLTAAKECNINYLRIWGGGHIESEAFYTLCDEYGLMILQEFPMSSSGCDDVPSKDNHFIDMLSKVALHNAKIKRNHVSLSMWDGGNELTDSRYNDCDDHEGHPTNYEDKTIAMLKGIVNSVSPDIMFLPSSGSGPNALLKQDDIGNNHDVHGPWIYKGVVDHYTLYNNSDSIIHGEFGCGGISNYSSLEKFLSQEDLKLFTSNTNDVWRHHSSGWDSYLLRERLMFGDLMNIPFVDYIKVNQFVQAESLRYSLESNRRRIWKNVGEMTWQFNEPWPNIQCSNVIDYFGEKKLAYYFMRDAYKSVSTTLKYDKLFYKADEDFFAEIYIVNDNQDENFTVSYSISTCKGETLVTGNFNKTAIEDTCTFIGKIETKLPKEISGGFIVKLTTNHAKYCENKEYLMLIADKKLPVQLGNIEKTQMEYYKNMVYANGLDDLRADYKLVIKYVDNYMSKEK